jgi:hypothetical protein
MASLTTFAILMVQPDVRLNLRRNQALMRPFVDVAIKP